MVLREVEEKGKRVTTSRIAQSPVTNAISHAFDNHETAYTERRDVVTGFKIVAARRYDGFSRRLFITIATLAQTIAPRENLCHTVISVLSTIACAKNRCQIPEIALMSYSINHGPLPGCWPCYRALNLQLVDLRTSPPCEKATDVTDLHLSHTSAFVTVSINAGLSIALPDLIFKHSTLQCTPVALIRSRQTHL